MLRLLEFFGEKNSSPIFSTMVRARASSPCTLLIGTIKPYNICYWHFLLRSFLSEIFDDPFHQTKKGETNKTVVVMEDYRSSRGAMILKKVELIGSEHQRCRETEKC